MNGVVCLLVIIATLIVACMSTPHSGKEERKADMDIESKLELGTPWAIYAGRVMELFAEDPSVMCDYDNDSPELKLRVDGADKADAISALLPANMEFGNITLKITVVPSNVVPDGGELFRRAFAGNPKFRDVAYGGPMGDVPYAMFEPKVVQLREDDLSKYAGVVTLTFEELAASVLDGDEARICSAID